jgi:hypothetical protein
VNINENIIAYADDTWMLFSNYSWDSVLGKAINETKKLYVILIIKPYHTILKKTFFITIYTI